MTVDGSRWLTGLRLCPSCGLVGEVRFARDDSGHIWNPSTRAEGHVIDLLALPNGSVEITCASLREPDPSDK